MNRRIQALGVIPARYASSRLPGKPLADIGGRPMIRRVAERAAQSALLSRVIVATDDRRILECIQAYGGEAVMTSPDFTSGTDRIASVVQNLDVGIVVNIQGDEPLIDPEDIGRVIRALQDDPDADMATLVTPVRSSADLISPNTAKVVFDDSGYALYFSRSPIPHLRDEPDPEAWLNRCPYYKHVGLYGYRKSFLLRFARQDPHPLEKAEKLEQLRALAMGAKIRVAETSTDPVCVDTPEDLERVRQLVTACRTP